MLMKSKFNISKKITSVTLAVALAITPNAFAAGFLEDFYNSAGAAANITPAQAYNTQTMGVVTGGGMVWKTPQRNFTPFSVTPPSLKAGCGGIDFFLGAFGMANKEQFVQFLRNVGQNAAGLAFKVALQAMAPELNAQIQEVADYINDWNKYFGNSCAAAQKLMDSGPSEWIRNTVEKAKNEMASNGTSTDISEATDKVKADSTLAIANAPKTINSGGKVVDGAEMNVLWSAMDSVSTAGILTDEDKFMIMSLIGTTVFKKGTGSAGETTLIGKPWPNKIVLRDLVGDINTPTMSKPMYKCNDSAGQCLEVETTNSNATTLTHVVRNKALNLQSAILTRSAPNKSDMMLLTATTSIPIFKLITLTTLPTRPGYSDELIDVYSTMIAWEVASRYIEDVALNVETMMKVSTDSDTNRQKVERLNEIKQRLLNLRVEMKTERSDLYQQMQRLGATIVLMDQMERTIYGNLSASILANMNYGR